MALPSPHCMSPFGASALTDFRFTYSYDVPTRSRQSGPAMNHDGRPKAGLLSLPTEIRHMIYHQLGFSTNHRRKVQTSRFTADELAVRASYFFTSGDGEHNQRGVQTPLAPIVKSKGIATQVMRVCRKIATETYELLYSDTNIGIGWDMATERGWYVGKRNAMTPESSALPFAPEPYPTFLGNRALSFVTHITLGPLSYPDYSDPLEIYIRMLDFIAFRCRKLQFLGIHLSDKCQIPSEGTQRLQPLIEALANVMRCCQLKKLWMGSARFAHENLDIEVAKHLASTSKYGELDRILAKARRRQHEAQKDLLSADENLTNKWTEFEGRQQSLGNVIASDYRVRHRKQELLDRMEFLLRNARAETNLHKLDGVPQTAVVAMQLQLSSYNLLVNAQELLATRIIGLQHLEALTAYICQQQTTEMDFAEQAALESKLRQCLEAPATKTTPLSRLHHRLTRMTALLPESLKFFTASTKASILDNMVSPIALGSTAEQDPETAAELALKFERRRRFAEIRAATVSAVKAALEAAASQSLERMPATEAREIMAEHIGKLMSNMGLKTSPSPTQPNSSPKGSSKASLPSLGAETAR